MRNWVAQDYKRTLVSVIFFYSFSSFSQNKNYLKNENLIKHLFITLYNIINDG